MKIVQKISSSPDTIYTNTPSIPAQAATSISPEKTADEIIQHIRDRYGIRNSVVRSSDTIDSLIQKSIGLSYNIAKPDYKAEKTAPVRDYGQHATPYLEISETQRVKKIDRVTQTEYIISESIGTQVQCMQSCVSSQASLLVLPSCSVGLQAQTNVPYSIQETQTIQQVVLLDDLEEIVSFMDDVVHQVTCQKVSRQVQTTDSFFVSECTQTIEMKLSDLGIQTADHEVNDSYSQTLFKSYSDFGTQVVSKVSDSCFQTDIMQTVDIGLDPIIFAKDDDAECIQYTKEQEEIFRKDFILNFLQDKLQEFRLELEQLN